MKRKIYSKKEREKFATERKAKVDHLMTAFDKTMSGFLEAVDEAAASEELHQFLRVTRQFYTYSFRNAILIYTQNPDATRVAGFHTWKKLNRYVKKGEHGIMIMRPQMNQRDATPSEVRDSKVETQDGKVGWMSFKPAYIFDVSQTNGEPLPTIDYNAKGDDGGLLNELLEAASNGSVVVEFVSKDEMRGADGLSFGGRVQVNKDLSSAGQAATLAHELAHEILHQGDVQKLGRPTKELEAEAVAYAVCTARGVEHPGAAKYVAYWRGLDTKIARKALSDSMGRVRNATAKLLGGNGPDKDAD